MTTSRVTTNALFATDIGADLMTDSARNCELGNKTGFFNPVSHCHGHLWHWRFERVLFKNKFEKIFFLSQLISSLFWWRCFSTQWCLWIHFYIKQQKKPRSLGSWNLASVKFSVVLCTYWTLEEGGEEGGYCVENYVIYEKKKIRTNSLVFVCTIFKVTISVSICWT